MKILALGNDGGHEVKYTYVFILEDIYFCLCFLNANNIDTFY